MKLPAHVQIVDTMDAFLSTEFTSTVNALALPRSLAGDFDMFARRLKSKDGRQVSMSVPQVERAARALPAETGTAGRAIAQDMHMIIEAGGQPRLNIICDNTDWLHFDRGRTPMGRILCTYTGATTRLIDDKSVDYSYKNNHIVPRRFARFHKVPLRALWRHATLEMPRQYEQAIVKPLVHTAPDTGFFSKPRLLLVGYFS